MFTDLVGSTELLRDGADVADELQRAHRDTAQAAIDAYRGTVVKGVGDGVMAVFSSANDAIACAGAIQQSTERARRRDPRHPLVRVGLSAGDAIYDDESRDWYGRPVIEAARLAAKGEAEGGQVLATGVLTLLAAESRADTLKPLGTRVLRGFDTPIDIYELVWEPAPMSVLPIPPAVERATRRPFVGRERELERLDQLGQDTAHARIVLISGEPGMGKTRIAAEFALRAYERGATVLWGGCEDELAVPYRPFVEALRYWFDNADDAEARRILDRTDVVRLLPELSTRFDDLAEPLVGEGEFERLRLFEHVSEILSSVASGAPTVMVLEDMHWATEPTILMFRHVARHVSRSLMFVATYRETELDRLHPLATALGELRRDSEVDRLALHGLDEVEVVEYLTRMMHESTPDTRALAALLQSGTNGNPFFIGETLRHLVERGDI